MTYEQAKSVFIIFSINIILGILYDFKINRHLIFFIFSGKIFNWEVLTDKINPSSAIPFVGGFLGAPRKGKQLRIIPEHFLLLSR